MTWTETTNLKFCLLNAENLFLLFDEPPTPEVLKYNERQWQGQSISIYENKSLKKCEDIAKSLIEINADIIMLCEVGGFESLKNFNHLFMNDAYSPCLIEGNSDRNIDVGFLIRKGLPFYFDLLSNKARLINYLYPHERQSLNSGYQVKGGKVTTSHKFSRDVVELRLFKQDKDKPFMIVLLTHLKSRLDPERIDPNGFERRQAELRTLLEIYRELEEKNPQIPIMVAGDFNGNAGILNTDEEFRDIYTSTGLKDVFEVANLSAEERATFYQVKSSARTEGRQIDFAFLSPLMQTLLKPGSAKAFRYRDEFGSERGIPQNMEAKMRIPSDHYPIVFEIENIVLR
ncbi:endonuclease/exonuclease/phosphatase family protein [Bdellovibrio sp. HCB185ZH]|uniref:endonuclease/exonuclease/phosphatase family protein n=1 Tax=Bdellovibrio sp. HCB185ZH TaxID=3394235 RepID=UPI0039A70A81